MPLPFCGIGCNFVAAFVPTLVGGLAVDDARLTYDLRSRVARTSRDCKGRVFFPAYK